MNNSISRSFIYLFAFISIYTFFSPSLYAIGNKNFIDYREEKVFTEGADFSGYRIDFFKFEENGYGITIYPKSNSNKYLYSGSMRQADFSMADFTGSDLREFDFNDAKDLTGALFNNKTKFPDSMGKTFEEQKSKAIKQYKMIFVENIADVIIHTNKQVLEKVNTPADCKACDQD